MYKKISALKVRQNLGQIMNEVSLTGDKYIIERAGKPLVPAEGGRSSNYSQIDLQRV
jgi:hypothetical protein